MRKRLKKKLYGICKFAVVNDADYSRVFKLDNSKGKAAAYISFGECKHIMGLHVPVKHIGTCRAGSTFGDRQVIIKGYTKAVLRTEGL